MPHRPLRFIASLFLIACIAHCDAVNVPITLFPLSDYDQNIDHWIQPTDANYQTPLLSHTTQQARFNEFYQHVYGNQSPWSKAFITKTVGSRTYLLDTELTVLHDFNNALLPQKDYAYGFNFHAQQGAWLQHIRDRMVLPSLLQQQSYDPARRAIMINNAAVRALPTQTPSFHHFTLAGEGYPFDMLQVSSLWAGTPIYVLAESKYHMWALVTSPSTLGWVPTNSFAMAEPSFIHAWHLYAKHGMAAIVQTQTPMVDTDKLPQFQAYVGSVFPLFAHHQQQMDLLIPVRNSLGNATIHHVIVRDEQAVRMPLRATPQHFAMLMHTLIGRPYGWGGLNFDNDCSLELKSLLTPFAIWLPRHSSDQVDAGQTKDLSRLTPYARIRYLEHNARPFLTLIEIKNHIMLYLGMRPNPYHPNQLLAMTYQNLWGLTPKDRSRRAVIGESVLFPLLRHYPENPHLDSLANSSIFTLSDLSAVPTPMPS